MINASKSKFGPSFVSVILALVKEFADEYIANKSINIFSISAFNTLNDDWLISLL